MESTDTNTITIYYNEPASLFDLGDCFSFGTSTHGSYSSLSDASSKGFASGMSTTIGAMSSLSEYTCSHFYRDDFELYSVTPEGTDASSKLTTRTFPGIISAGSCI